LGFRNHDAILILIRIIVRRILVVVIVRVVFFRLAPVSFLVPHEDAVRLRNQSRAFSASVWIWIFHLGFFVFLLRRFISIRSVFAKLFHHTQRVRDEIVVAPESPAQRKRARLR
jgi:hypothetical protein